LQCCCDKLLLVFCKQTLHRNIWLVSGRYQMHTTCYRQYNTHFLSHRMKKATVWNVCVQSFYSFSKWYLCWRLLQKPQMLWLHLTETDVHS
jgi:hypothetical protein